MKPPHWHIDDCIRYLWVTIVASGQASGQANGQASGQAEYIVIRGITGYTALIAVKLENEWSSCR